MGTARGPGLADRKVGLQQAVISLLLHDADVYTMSAGLAATAAVPITRSASVVRAEVSVVDCVQGGCKPRAFLGEVAPLEVKA